MKVLVLNGSPAGDDSITLFTVKYIERFFPSCTFEVLHVGKFIKKMERDFSESAEALQNADLILFSYPVYTFLVPAQLHRFVELMKEQGIDLSGKYATQISTSKHFYDMTAHRFLEENCYDLGLRYLRGLSADMDDLLTETGRKQALDFFSRVVWSVEHGLFECPPQTPAALASVPLREQDVQPVCEKKTGKVVIVTDYGTDPAAAAPLQAMVERFRALLPFDSAVVDLQQFPFKGGCIGCFNCAATGKCFYKDGFDDYLRSNIQDSEAIVYAYTIKDHSMGYRMKLYDDRQFCNGHRTVTMGKPVGYLVHGDLSQEANLRLLMEARAQVGGNFLSGIACDTADPDREIEQLALQLTYAVTHHYEEPQNFYGVGGLKIFRDLIYQMQGLMKADHKFYKEHGFYDFPQKRKGRIIGMYAVGALMQNKTLQKKAGGKMTEGMTMPYRKVLDRAPAPKAAEKKEPVKIK
ncbi:MAG: NAD(P)H-dependent oxidoreductase [Clostridia bacterium]|nr:NAD(P)H-dependent oxidoreductase [Clostridia bacterium]